MGLERLFPSLSRHRFELLTRQLFARRAILD